MLGELHSRDGEDHLRTLLLLFEIVLEVISKLAKTKGRFGHTELIPQSLLLALIGLASTTSANRSSGSAATSQRRTSSPTVMRRTASPASDPRTKRKPSNFTTGPNSQATPSSPPPSLTGPWTPARSPSPTLSSKPTPTRAASSKNPGTSSRLIPEPRLTSRTRSSTHSPSTSKSPMKSAATHWTVR